MYRCCFRDETKVFDKIQLKDVINLIYNREIATNRKHILEEQHTSTDKWKTY